MKSKLNLLPTGLIVLGLLLGLRACMFATNRWTYDDNLVLPLLGGSAAAIVVGVYFRVRGRK